MTEFVDLRNDMYVSR